MDDPHNSSAVRALNDDIQAKKAKHSRVLAELQQIQDRHGDRLADLPEGPRQRVENLTRAMQNLQDDLTDLTRERDDRIADHADVIDKLRSGELALLPGHEQGAIPGDSSSARTSPSWSPQRHLNPWDRPATGTADELRGRALTAVERDEAASDHAREHASRFLERAGDDTAAAAQWALVASDPDYMGAFRKALADPTAGHMTWTGREREAWVRSQDVMRAMNLGSTSAGHALVPFSLDPSIVQTNSGIVNPFRQVSRSVTIASDVWHGVTSDGITAEWLAETSEAADATPTFSQPAIKAEKAAAWIEVSIELNMDAPTFAQELGGLIADAKDRLEGAAFTTGTGSGQPFGVVSRVAAVTASRVAATTNNSFGVEDVYSTIEALPPRHQPNATWMAALPIINRVRKFATGSGPQHAFVADLAAGQPPTILGKPLYECSTMDGTIGTGDDDVLLVGDFTSYAIVDRIGASVELVPHVMGANRRPVGVRGFFAFWRVGADVTNTAAFRLLRI